VVNVSPPTIWLTTTIYSVTLCADLARLVVASISLAPSSSTNSIMCRGSLAGFRGGL
jgi:hypothetical protein